MNLATRIALPVLGLVAFVLVWQLVVSATRPQPIRRVTLGLSVPRGEAVGAVILGARGDAVARASLPLSDTGSQTVREWLGTHQPTLAAVPAGSDGEMTPVLAVLEKATTAFGGGLDRHVSEGAFRTGDPVEEAAARARTLQDEHLMWPSWIPDPSEAGVALASMVRSGEMVRHIVASLFRVATGFLIATLLGIPVGLLLGAFARLSALCNAVIQCLRPISPIAWLPIATLTLGGGDLAAVFLIFLASFFPIVVSTAAAVATVDLKYRRSALNFGVHGLAAARRVILPAAFPAILTALRIALGVSWLVVVAAEMLGVESGLGFLVLDARNQLRYDRVVAAMITIGAIGLGLDILVRRLERAQLERRGLVR